MEKEKGEKSDLNNVTEAAEWQKLTTKINQMVRKEDRKKRTGS